MTQRSPQTEADRPELSVPLETACYIAIKARELDAKEDADDNEDGSNPTDDNEMEVLDEGGDDPALEEITSIIKALTIDGQIDLVTLMWLGRGDYAASDWPSLREEAADAHNEHTAEYLCGTPLLADYLSEGLSLIGYSCAEYEEQHL
ncbi:uncharacterized protein DUF3775 [Breoghania corrubedonensis]|uniref:Uncharacterized protein DUF3775 n=1 Tax=Breoghania corrubedonensis TaxID=665038 RepID=A0A2T5V7T7_9HYPH|nr:DUF3775 domain-containing protein [Breoghania corrubedonensis]PTW59804.1 uncharacterized protein DUF3775 [Breoghania corrubedonensis]